MIWSAKYCVPCSSKEYGGAAREGKQKVSGQCSRADSLNRAWYDRLALVLMTHYGGDVDKKREAVLVCHEGLTDPDTHLSKRLRFLGPVSGR